MSSSTSVSKVIHAAPAAIYNACLDPVLLAKWRVPDNMQAEVHEFEAWEGGRYRMTLTYVDAADSPGGKTTSDTDTFSGRFISLVADRQVVELIDFVSDDPAFAGQMKMTTRLNEVADGTEVTITCEDIPLGIRPEDNELGCRLALDNLEHLLSDADRLK